MSCRSKGAQLLLERAERRIGKPCVNPRVRSLKRGPRDAEEAVPIGHWTDDLDQEQVWAELTPCSDEFVDLPMESWKWIPGSRGYDASSLGRIRCAVDDGYRLIAPVANLSTGYFCFTMPLLSGERMTMLVHRSVLLAHRGEPPVGKPCARHVHNPSVACNELWNLKWGSYAENTADARRHAMEGLPTARGAERDDTWTLRMTKRSA